MMTTRFVEIMVGFFVLLGVVALMLLATQVSGLTDFCRRDSGYPVTADFENIGGLKVRSKVTLNGVRVGCVSHIALHEEKTPNGTLFIARVTLSFNKKMNSIPNDVHASIYTSGLLGDNYLALEPGFSPEMLKEGGHIPLENTQSAVILENLISKLVSTKASKME